MNRQIKGMDFERYLVSGMVTCKAICRVICKVVCILMLIGADTLQAATDYESAVRRAQYLLNGTMPTDAELSASSISEIKYRETIDGFLG
ncbi:MAG: hypothetical protein NTV34_20290, partial [Proteobacteria bacterium]|nr:hypothetical protein [Pseudomonadota bacterium]